jgi:DNA-binding CsgD family transcriptional regulator
MQLPRALGSAAQAVAGAREDPARLKTIFQRNAVPMVMVDEDRRYVHVNPPALLAFRVRLAEIRERRIDDLTPRYRLSLMNGLWSRLVETGCVTGRYDVANPDGTQLSVVFYALADPLPGLYLIAFAPEGWSDLELAAADPGPSQRRSDLSARELQLLQLAAEGRSGPRIAQELGLSPATVKKHFERGYAKLGVRDRATAVAKAMRLGLID